VRHFGNLKHSQYFEYRKLLMLMLTYDFTGYTALQYHHNRLLALIESSEFTSPKEGSLNLIHKVLV
jgi:hypothetical protein